MIFLNLRKKEMLASQANSQHDNYFPSERQPRHSWVLGVDNLAKWQKNILQLKYLGGFMAMNLQILDK